MEKKNVLPTEIPEQYCLIFGFRTFHSIKSVESCLETAIANDNDEKKIKEFV